MPVQRKYDDETRARAVRLYVERRKSDPAESQVASRRHVGGLIGVGPETLRGWVERDERNAGARPGLSDEASAEVRQLRKENAELKRANEILRTASADVGDRCQVPVSWLFALKRGVRMLEVHAALRVALWSIMRRS